MKKDFTKYEQALALKELGFDEDCFYHYEYHSARLCEDKAFLIAGNGNKYYKDTNMEKSVNAPLYQQAFRWFREKYGLIGQPMPLCISYPGKVTHYGWSIVSNQNSIDWENEDNGFKIYEEAENTCLDKLIEIVRLTKL